ncbi:MAG: hypothetical protein MZU97_15550 [Bacillus subtilis]|nr:hypothetical protein [Bacillus subtilis]
MALGIRHVGQKTAKNIAESFPIDRSRCQHATVIDLAEGPKTSATRRARAIVDYFADPANQRLDRRTSRSWD